MFPQSRRVWPAVVTIILVIFAVNNPAKAADLVNQVINAITTFADKLGS